MSEAPIDHEVIPRYEPGVAGWVHLAASEIHELAATIPQFGRYVEIGSASGASAAMLADARPDLSIVCVDIFVGDLHEGNPDGHWSRSRRWIVNRRPNMNLWVGTIHEFARASFAPFHAALVDAGHEYAECLSDLCDVQGLLLPGAVLFAHDYQCPEYPGVQQAVDEFRAANGWRLERVVHRLAVMVRG